MLADRCMTFADCRLHTADCGLQTADYRAQIADCKLKDTKNLPNKGDTIKNITSCESEKVAWERGWYFCAKLHWGHFQNAVGYQPRPQGFFPFFEGKAVGTRLWFWVKISNFFKLCTWLNVTWKWCLLVFKRVIKVILTRYEEIKFALPPCRIFAKGVRKWFWAKFQISSKLVYVQIGPRNDVSGCFRVKLKWFWRYMKMSNMISRHLGFFPKE